MVYDIWGNWNPTFVKDSALTLGFNVDFGYNGATGEPDSGNPAFGSGSGSTFSGVGDSNTWWGAAALCLVQAEQGCHGVGSR